MDTNETIIRKSTEDWKKAHGLGVNSEIAPDKFQCGLDIRPYRKPFYGCEDGVGRWCFLCPALKNK